MSAPYPGIFPFFLHSVTSAGAGAGGGGEDPHKNPYRLKSTHEADVVGDQNPYEETEADQSAHAKRIKPNYPADPGSFGPCPVCERSFKSSKALHGHMRCHPERAWRGMVPPEKWAAHAASTAGGSGVGSAEWPFRCRGCGANFRTKQALGGHRASHKSKRGCYMIAREASQLLHGANINNNNNNNINNNLNNTKNNNEGVVAGVENNNAGGNNRRMIVDLNLPPPEEEEEEEDKD